MNFLDGAIGEIVEKLKSKGMWNDTVVVLQSDNTPLPLQLRWAFPRSTQ